MTEEGTVQLLQSWNDLDFYVAAVGRLQFDVLQYRLKSEYGADTHLELLPYQSSAWLGGRSGNLRPAGRKYSKPATAATGP